MTGQVNIYDVDLDISGKVRSSYNRLSKYR